MNHYFWASSLLLFAVVAVQYPAVAAFKIPGLSSGSSGTINRTPPVRGPAANAGGHRGPESEYMGPVFIIRELDKDKGEYDAFVTTGGIQEVRPPPMSDRSLPPQHVKPSAAVRDDEDDEHFGVLVTPETVKQLDRDLKLRASSVNVTVAVLLSAASSRMPWLLVLHRKQYPHLFEYQQQHQAQYQQQHQPQYQQQHQPQYQPQHQQHHQQQPPQYLQQVPSDAVQIDSGMPGLQHPQIPQRRRYQTDRHRRAILYSSPPPEPPMAFEHQLLSTMCYNFVRDYYSSPVQQTAEQSPLPGLPIALADAEYAEDRRERLQPEPEPEQYGRYRQDVYLDANAYAAAATATSGRAQQSPPTPSAVRPEEQSDGGGVVADMAIPKRVS